MTDNSRKSCSSSLLQRVRNGEERAFDELMRYYRPYLSLLARTESNPNLRSKLSESDLVQETCMSAHRDFGQFHGTTEPEFTAWLREIMAHVAANVARNFYRQRRDVRLEHQMSDHFNQSSQALEHLLQDPRPSPSQSAIGRERAVLLARALDSLSKDHQDVLVMRELQGMSLNDVAASMGRTVNATQKLWARALVQLRRQMQLQSDSSDSELS